MFIIECQCGKLIHDHSAQEGVKNASIETCMESSKAITDPVESFTNVTTCLRFLVEFHHLYLNPPGDPIPSIQSHSQHTGETSIQRWFSFFALFMKTTDRCDQLTQGGKAGHEASAENGNA